MKRLLILMLFLASPMLLSLASAQTSDPTEGEKTFYEGCADSVGATGVLTYARVESKKGGLISNIYIVYVFSTKLNEDDLVPIWVDRGRDPYMHPQACQVLYIKKGDLVVRQLESDVPDRYETEQVEECPVWRASAEPNINWDIFFVQEILIYQIDFWLHENTVDYLTTGSCPIVISESIIAYRHTNGMIAVLPLAPELEEVVWGQGSFIVEGTPLRFYEHGRSLFYAQDSPRSEQSSIMIYDITTRESRFLLHGSQIAIDQEEFAFVVMQEGLCLVVDLFADEPSCDILIDENGKDPDYRSTHSDFSADLYTENQWIRY